MPYVDGMVAAVPTANREKYQALSATIGEIFRSNGALSYVECWGDDVPEGKLTSFPLAVQCKLDETVVFSWVTWPSREARDAGMKATMSDPRMQANKDMPFDGQRMIFGGFEAIVEL